MEFAARPLAVPLGQISGLSERLLTSHHANNYTGAVKRLNAIRSQLAALDFSAAPGFQVNGFKREQRGVRSSPRQRRREGVRRSARAHHRNGRDGPDGRGVHPHMTDESPRSLFLHDWGKAKAVDLARALKRAVDTQRLEK